MRNHTRRALFPVVACVLLAGCYRITVTSGPQPPADSATVVEYPWQHSWVYGLVPPPEVNVRDRCPSGVAKVETKMSFLNGLASVAVGTAANLIIGGSDPDPEERAAAAALSGLWTPLSTKVTCAPR